MCYKLMVRWEDDFDTYCEEYSGVVHYNYADAEAEAMEATHKERLNPSRYRVYFFIEEV